MRILVLNGPNLNMLGKRDENHYGSFTLEDVEKEMTKTAASVAVEIGNEVEVEFFQSNHEGNLIDVIQVAKLRCQGIVFNPGAFTHYSYAIRDAIEACGIPVMEVHISDIHSREDFRKVSVTLPVCVGQIAGRGILSYVDGLRELVKMLNEG